MNGNIMFFSSTLQKYLIYYYKPIDFVNDLYKCILVKEILTDKPLIGFPIRGQKLEKYKYFLDMPSTINIELEEEVVDCCVEGVNSILYQNQFILTEFDVFSIQNCIATWDKTTKIYLTSCIKNHHCSFLVGEINSKNDNLRYLKYNQNFSNSIGGTLTNLVVKEIDYLTIIETEKIEIEFKCILFNKLRTLLPKEIIEKIYSYDVGDYSFCSTVPKMMWQYDYVPFFKKIKKSPIKPKIVNDGNYKIYRGEELLYSPKADLIFGGHKYNSLDLCRLFLYYYVKNDGGVSVSFVNTGQKHYYLTLGY